MRKKSRCFVLLCFALLATGPFLWSQAVPGGGPRDEPFAFVGMNLNDLINRFGSPQSVYAARGERHWQDDVVFVYADNDFYIYRDRVWQVGLKSIYGIKIGDAKGVVSLVLGERAQDMGDYILYHLPPGIWPLSIRVYCIAGRVSSIFVYRPDY